MKITLLFDNKHTQFEMCCECGCVFSCQERVFLTISNYVFTAIFVAEMTVKVKHLTSLSLSLSLDWWLSTTDINDCCLHIKLKSASLSLELRRHAPLCMLGKSPDEESHLLFTAHEHHHSHIHRTDKEKLWGRTGHMIWWCSVMLRRVRTCVCVQTSECHSQMISQKSLSHSKHWCSVTSQSLSLSQVVSMGLYLGERAYLRSSWNVLDGFLVFVSLIDIVVSMAGGAKILGVLRVLRLLRTLRPLRWGLETADVTWEHINSFMCLPAFDHVCDVTFFWMFVRVISRAPGLKLVVETLITSLKPIGNIVLICCAFFIIFGILGVQVHLMFSVLITQ